MDRERVIGALRAARSKVTWFGVIVGLVSLYTVWRVVARLKLGADVTDESFYAVVQHRFALGDKPYLDEVNLRQNAAFITLPLYWARLKIKGNTDGIILFLRFVYFVFTCGTAYSIYRFARTRIGHTPAVLVGLLGIAFIPFNVPTCSYNTLGCTFLTTGIFLSLWRLSATEEEPAPLAVHYASGFAHGLAVIAYPPLAIPVVLFTVVTPWFDESKRRFRNVGLYVGGGLTTVLLILPLLSAAGPKGIREAIAYERALTQPRTMDKLKAVVEELWNLAPLQQGGAAPRLLVVTLLFIVAARSFGVVRQIVLPCILPGIAWWVNTPALRGPVDQHTVGLYFNVYSGLAGLAFVALGRLDKQAWRLVFCCLVPSAIAGLINGYSSDNGAMNAGLGAFPAAVLAVILAVEIASNGGRRRQALLWASATAASLVYYHIELSYALVYRDGPAETLKTRVRFGPFRGLYTTEKNAAEIHELVTVLRKFEDRTARMVSFYDFPAAYIVTRMKPGMPSSWTDSRIPASPFMMDYYRRHLTGRGLVVRWPVWNRHGRTELDVLVEDPTRILYRGSNGWVLYREPPPSVALPAAPPP